MRLATFVATTFFAMPLVAQATWQPLVGLPQTFAQNYVVAFDTTRNRLHLFDGSTNLLFDGVGWIGGQHPTVSVIKAAYDPLRDLMVIAGFGQGGLTQARGFDGTSWMQLGPQAPSFACYGLVWHEPAEGRLVRQPRHVRVGRSGVADGDHHWHTTAAAREQLVRPDL